MISEETKEKILQQLIQIEQKDDVRVVFAVESGSRAWGFESTSSDYDVRFVYVRRPEKYVTILEPKDSKNPSLEDPMLDFSGWDLRKAMQLLAKSNPDFIGWAMSPIIYLDRVFFANSVHWFAMKNFSQKAMGYHNLHIARHTYETYLMKDQMICGKKYFYAIRPLLNILYVRKFGSLPPIDFQYLLASTRDFALTPGEYQTILALLDWKKMEEVGEKSMRRKIVTLDSWIVQNLKLCTDWVSNCAEDHRLPIEEIDDMFRSFLKESERLFEEV